MVNTKVFRVEGSFRMGHIDQSFSKEVAAPTPERAKELLQATLGSKHHVPRRLIKITRVIEVPIDQVEDPVVRHLVQG